MIPAIVTGQPPWFEHKEAHIIDHFGGFGGHLPGSSNH
jgi:hypothetical protein